MAIIKTILRVTSSGIDASAGFWQYKGLWTSATALPTAAKTGWVYKFSVDCVVNYLGGSVTYSAGTLIVATANDSGSVTDWYPLARG